MKKKNRFKLIYKGNSFKDADAASKSFWKNVEVNKKLEAVTLAIQEAYLLKGINFHALRLDRTTAVIRKA